MITHNNVNNVNVINVIKYVINLHNNVTATFFL